MEVITNTFLSLTLEKKKLKNHAPTAQSLTCEGEEE